MLKITAPRLVKNLREDVDWMDCISRQEDDFTECSFNGLCVEDVSKQNLSVNSCLFTNCGFIACNYRKSQFSDVVLQSAKPPVHLFKTKRFYFEVLFQNEASLLEQNQTAFKWTSNPI